MGVRIEGLGNGYSPRLSFRPEKSIDFAVEKSFLLFCGGASLDLSTTLEMTRSGRIIIPQIVISTGEGGRLRSGEIFFTVLWLSLIHI